MLMQSIRDHATGWIAWVIVILISIPFALWGIQQYLSPASNAAVAVVNGTEIGIDQFQRTYQRQRAQLQSLLGGSFDINQLDDERLRDEALNQLVNDEVVLQSAHDEGMRIGDKQVAQAIQSQETFQNNGVFDEALYEQWVRNQGYSPDGFWNDLKRSMLATQFTAGVATSAFVTKRELDNAVRLLSQKRVFDTLTVPAARFSDIKIDDDAIKAYYEKNQVDYVSPEQVKIAYIEVSRDAIAAGISVSDDDLRAEYERRKADFQTPEQREASHILLKLEEGADDKAVAEARARLEEIKRQIEGGASFADLARKYSEDPGSAKQGGSLGTISRGIMDPNIENAVFSLALGEVSDPIRSAFGLHLVKVDAITPSKVPSFDEVRDKMRAAYQKDKAEQAFVERVDTLATLAFEHPDSLDAAASALGLTPTVSDWLSPKAASNSGIGSNPAITEAAFSPDVLQGGYNSEPIEIGPTRVIVLRMAEFRPSRQLALDEVRERIRSDLIVSESQKRAAEDGRALLERLQAGEDPKSVAAQAELQWSGEAERARGAAEEDENVMRTVFRMPRPPSGQPTFAGTTSHNGDFVIVSLARVVDGSMGDSEKEQRLALKRTLEVETGRAAYDAVVKTLRDNADVSIIRENL